METKGSLPHSQQPATYHYAQPDLSNPCPHPTSRRSILVLSSHLCLVLPSNLLPSRFLTKTLLSPYVLHAFPILFYNNCNIYDNSKIIKYFKCIWLFFQLCTSMPWMVQQIAARSVIESKKTVVFEVCVCLYIYIYTHTHTIDSSKTTGWILSIGG